MPTDGTNLNEREYGRSDYERRLLQRADMLDSLVTAFLTELRVHTDLLRHEIENQERPS